MEILPAACGALFLCAILSLDACTKPMECTGSLADFFNKVGDAYGFLTDAAYIIDVDAGIEFILAATVYANANETFNDNVYEYDSVGLPFLRALGQAIYDIERDRPRAHWPDLSRFR